MESSRELQVCVSNNHYVGMCFEVGDTEILTSNLGYLKIIHNFENNLCVYWIDDEKWLCVVSFWLLPS